MSTAQGVSASFSKRRKPCKVSLFCPGKREAETAAISFEGHEGVR
jgi:hypothetical protein